MTKVENLLKHKIPFQLRGDIFYNHGDLIILKEFSYKAISIKLYIENKEDLHNKFKPILHYLVSKHMTEEHEGYYYNSSNFNIYVRTEDDDHDIGLLFLVALPTYDDARNEFVFMMTDFNDDDRFTCLNLIKIKINIRCLNYKLEGKTKIPTKISFKYDECVICLTNPPNVLFNNCGHICICYNCDRESLNSCPICRAVTSIKWRI